MALGIGNIGIVMEGGHGPLTHPPTDTNVCFSVSTVLPNSQCLFNFSNDCLYTITWRGSQCFKNHRHWSTEMLRKCGYHLHHTLHNEHACVVYIKTMVQTPTSFQFWYFFDNGTVCMLHKGAVCFNAFPGKVVDGHQQPLLLHKLVFTKHTRVKIAYLYLACEHRMHVLLCLYKC